MLRQLRALGRPRDERVVIVAHSLGGLDARHMISRLGMAGRVAGLVTIATPHRGSTYADWVVGNLGRRLGGERLVRALGLDLRALTDLTTPAMTQFNDLTPDAPGVAYLSISTRCAPAHVPAFYRHSHGVVFRHEGENDGLVSVVSARWGEHLGTWPVDHLHAINKRVTPHALRAENDITPRYDALLGNLAHRGLL